MLRAGERAVLAVHEGLYLIDEKLCVAIGAAAAEPGHVRWSVFADARFGVVHADDDERLDLAGLDAIIRRRTDVPVLPGDEGSGAVKKILAVMKIKDGKTAPGLLRVAGRSVDDKVALVAKEARTKLFVFAELSGAHGAMVTRRSF